MATAAPHVKLLRQLASAKDDYLSGAFDITWDGAKATLYLVFGRPSHAVFETDHASIEGEAAIDALLAELPRTFVVSDWRRAMSPQETLSITIDELAGPFVRLAGSYADDPVTEETPEWWSATDDAPDLAFGIADFPLLPGGRPLWAETSPENVHLAEQLAELPPSILILTGAKLRAAAVVSGGDLIDAVWIDADDQARGEAAGMAILGTTKGSLAGYALDDPRVAEALTMLWRLPLAVSGVELSWLDPASMLAAFRADGLDRVLVIDAPVRGIALFSRGGLVAVYSETQRSAVASPERLRSLLSQARGRLSVMERKPRPLDGAVTEEPLNAFEFFDVEPLAPAAEITTESPPAPAAPVADADAPVADADAPVAEPVAESTDAPPAPTLEEGSTAASGLPAETGAVAAPAAAGSDAELPPPPPPPDVSTVAAETPAAPAPEAVPAARKPKRSWWSFGTHRRGRSDASDEAQAEAAVTGPAPQPEAEAGTFAGWSVRQQGTATAPPWIKSRDQSDGSSSADHWAPAETAGDAEAIEPAAAEGSTPDAAAAHEGAGVESSEPAAHDEAVSAVEAESPAEAQAADEAPAADAQGWSVRPAGGATEADAASPAESASEAPVEDPLDFWGSGGVGRDATIPDEAEPVDADHHDVAVAQAAAHDADADGAHAVADDGAVGEEPSEVGPDAAAEAETSADNDVAAGPDATAEQNIGAEAESATEHEVAADAEATTESEVAAEAEATGEHDVASEAEPEEESADAAGIQAADEDHGAAEAGSDAADEPVAAGRGDSERHAHPTALGRTLAPWSWPLAEPGLAAHTGGSDRVGPPLEPVAAGVSDAEIAESQPTVALSSDTGFFSRDDPVGSQYVDFDEVRKELVQIGVVWLGEASAAPVTALLTRTRSTIDDFVATIDTIRGLHLEGQDPASVQAMAREMHQQAAERLCGA